MLFVVVFGIGFLLTLVIFFAPWLLPCKTSADCGDGALCVYREGCDRSYGVCQSACGELTTRYCDCDGYMKVSGNTCIEEPFSESFPDPSYLSCKDNPHEGDK